jgi:hypothetical protein
VQRLKLTSFPSLGRSKCPEPLQRLHNMLVIPTLAISLRLALSAKPPFYFLAFLSSQQETVSTSIGTETGFTIFTS